MSQELIITIEEHFESLPVPRKKTANQRHKFIDITFQQFVAQSVKDNQPNRNQAIQNDFIDANQANFEGYNIDYAETINKAHGRLSPRRCWVGYDIQDIIDKSQEWRKLETIVMIESERTENGETTIEHRYYIGSSNDTASKLLNASRKHWEIENSLHWILDIALRVR